MPGWEDLNWIEFSEFLIVAFECRNQADLLKLPVAVFSAGSGVHDSGEVVLVTSALAQLIGARCDELLGLDMRFMVPSEKLVHDVLNEEQFEPVEKLHQLAFQASSEEFDEQAAPVTAFVVTPNRQDHAFWNLLTVFPARFLDGSRCLVHVSSRLEVDVPRKAVWPCENVGWSVSQVTVLEKQMHKIHEEFQYLAISTAWDPRGEISRVLVPRISELCNNAAILFSDALEGGHFVPAVGGAAVTGFKNQRVWVRILHEVRELRTLWNVCDSECSDGMTIACAVSDYNALDCPLVYVSPGFEVLTGYKSDFAAGRNCRFLQPKEADRNHAFNGPELIRMKKFCTQDRSGRIFNLLLNEKRDTGEPFWNLLYMQHVQLNVHGERKHYIFGLQTNLAMQKETMSLMMPWRWTANGLAILARLRAILRENEVTFHPTQSSFSELATRVTSQWVLEFNSGAPGWAMQALCHDKGHQSVVEFIGKFPDLANSVLKSVIEVQKLRRLFLDDTVLCRKFESDPQVLCCALLDAAGTTHSCSFMSSNFTEMTGHATASIIGKSFWCEGCCLHLADERVNAYFNGDSLVSMREFCDGEQKPGSMLGILLLNKRPDGCSFWHLFHLAHTSLSGRPVIISVQTELELPVPEDADEDCLCSDDDLQAEKAEYCIAVGRLLNASVTAQQSLNAEELQQATTTFQQLLKLGSTDYVGDNLVPKVDEERILLFRRSTVCQHFVRDLMPRLGLFHRTLGCNEDLICSIQDTSIEGSPLVHVSEGFVQRLGYTSDWCLGRNIHFLHPRLECRHQALNIVNESKTERFHRYTRRTSFTDSGLPYRHNAADHRNPYECDEGMFPLQPDTWVLSLQVIEDAAGRAFWNLMFLEEITIDAREYDIAVHTIIDPSWSNLYELLTSDKDGVQELQRLRKIIQEHAPRLLEGRRVHDILNESMESWSSDFPLFMSQRNICQNIQVPISPAGRSQKPPHIINDEMPMTPIPSAMRALIAMRTQPSLEDRKLAISSELDFLPQFCLELTAETLLTRTVSDALRNGCKHIQFAFPSVFCGSPRLKKAGDDYVDVLASRISSLFRWMHYNYYDYRLTSDFTFGLRTPPQYIGAKVQIQEVLASHGFKLSYWLLDAADVRPSYAVDCWTEMSEGHEGGDVPPLGLFCASLKVITAVQSCSAAKIAVLAGNLYRQEKVRGAVLDGSDLEMVSDMLQMPAAMMACSIFGERCTVPQGAQKLEDAMLAQAEYTDARLQMKQVSLDSVDSWPDQNCPSHAAMLLKISDMHGFGFIFHGSDTEEELDVVPAMTSTSPWNDRILMGEPTLPDIHRTIPREVESISEKQIRKFVDSLRLHGHNTEITEPKLPTHPMTDAWSQTVKRKVAEFEHMFLQKSFLHSKGTRDLETLAPHAPASAPGRGKRPPRQFPVTSKVSKKQQPIQKSPAEATPASIEGPKHSRQHTQLSKSASARRAESEERVKPVDQPTAKPTRTGEKQQVQSSPLLVDPAHKPGLRSNSAGTGVAEKTSTKQKAKTSALSDRKEEPLPVGWGLKESMSSTVESKPWRRPRPPLLRNHSERPRPIPLPIRLSSKYASPWHPST